MSLVITREVTPSEIEALRGSRADSDLLATLFFYGKGGGVSHDELWHAVGRVFVTLVTDGGNKAAMYSPYSQRARDLAFYKLLHDSESKAKRVLALRCARDAARPFCGGHAEGRRLVEIMSIIKSAFFSVWDADSQSLPIGRGAASTLSDIREKARRVYKPDEIDTAVKTIQRAQQSGQLTDDHVHDLFNVLASSAPTLRLLETYTTVLEPRGNATRRRSLL